MQQQNPNTFSPILTVAKTHSPFSAIPARETISVIGAGAFGGWSALSLLRKGYHVTLVDSWGAGNSRSSSGDETRVIRSTYGANELYFQLNARALQLWKEHEIQTGKKFFHNTGVIWLCYKEHNPIIDDSIPFSVKYKMEYEKISPSELRGRFPEINSNDLTHAFLDPFGGYLKARESCQSVLELFIKEGGTYVQDHVLPGKKTQRRLNEIVLSNGSVIKSDNFLFACGSWLATLFPQVLSSHLNCTKQEVYYFGVPAGHSVAFDRLPVWIDLDGEDFYYGIPSNASRGFKIGVDRRGVAFDPTTGERSLSAEVLTHAREFLAHRFPLLKNAPLLENRVCPYENSTSGNFIFDHHPDYSNVYLLGGGSGHGFKHGPALGELVSNCLSSEANVPDLFRIF